MQHRGQRDKFARPRLFFARVDSSRLYAGVFLGCERAEACENACPQSQAADRMQARKRQSWHLPSTHRSTNGLPHIAASQREVGDAFDFPHHRPQFPMLRQPLIPCTCSMPATSHSLAHLGPPAPVVQGCLPDRLLLNLMVGRPSSGTRQSILVCQTEAAAARLASLLARAGGGCDAMPASGAASGFASTGRAVVGRVQELIEDWQLGLLASQVR